MLLKSGRARHCMCISFQLIRNLMYLRCVPYLVTADKQHPLIEIDRTKHRMWLNDLAQRAPIAREKGSTQRLSRLLESDPGRLCVDIAWWTNFIRRIPSFTTISD